MTTTTAAPGLRSNAIGLTGALMQSVTTMSPAITVAYTVPFLALTSGTLSPLVVLVAAVVSYLLGYTLAQLARHISSASTYQTFVSRVLGPKAGFLVAWMYLLFYPVATAMLCGQFGLLVSQIGRNQLGVEIPWVVPMLSLMVFIGILAYRGVELAIGVTVFLGAFEIVVMMALSVWGLANPGAGGTNLDWLLGGGGWNQGFFLGVVFSVYSLTGWDAAASLGEETSNPLKNIPRAVLGSIVILGVFVVITTWGQLAGWGMDDLESLIASEELPVLVLAEKFWGPLSVFAYLALINCIIGSALACMNASTRFLYGMARSGALPRPIAKLSRRQTPVGAIVLQSCLNLGLGFLMIAAVGLENIYTFTGVMFTFALTFVYIMGGITVYRMYRTIARAEFRVFKHVIIPAVASIALLVVVFYSVNPYPEPPMAWALPVVVVWLIAGVAVLAVRVARRDTAWLDAAANEGTLRSDLHDPDETTATPEAQGARP